MLISYISVPITTANGEVSYARVDLANNQVLFKDEHDGRYKIWEDLQEAAEDLTCSHEHCDHSHHSVDELVQLLKDELQRCKAGSTIDPLYIKELEDKLKELTTHTD